MGEVIAARDRHLDREIAIKRLHAERRDPRGLARFVREARVQARLEHPAIAPVHELDRDDDGYPFLVMKRINGTSLADSIAELDRGDPAAMHRLLASFGQVCLAIAYAHEKGVVHRDIKPNNIVLGCYGDVYVLDWGVAKVIDEAEVTSPDHRDRPVHDHEALTEAGGIIGTPAYMAPEQVAGAAIDGRVDVYALGCVLFEILVGARMHPPDWRFLPLSEDERRPSRHEAKVAPELDDLCVRATATDPGERIASARELHRALDRYLSGDRDLARRRELASSCRERAEVALSGGDGADARSTAMREASQALALDPDDVRARALVARLVLEPPAEVPEEVRVALDANRAQRIQHFGRIGIATFVSLSVFLPFMFWMGIRRPWFLVVVVLAASVGIGSAARCMSGRGGRWSPYGAMFAGACLVVLASRIFSSFTIAPILAMAWASASFVHPARLSTAVIVAAFSVASLAPPLLEAVGLLEATVRFDDGILVVDNAGLWFPQLPTLLAFSTIIVVGLLMTANVLVKTRRKLEDEERALALQAWQLQGGLPTGTLERRTTR
jgi:eukaryotic-like serine/threonine-protein kinase